MISFFRQNTPSRSRGRMWLLAGNSSGRWISGALVALCLAAGSLGAQQNASFMVVDLFNRKIHMARGQDQKRPVGSLTKIATACVVLDWIEATRGDQATLIQVPFEVTRLEGVASSAGLLPGDRLSIRDAMAACLVASDHIAAYALADYVGRSLQQRTGQVGDPVALFVRQMNLLASKEGLMNTQFTNPAGLDHFRRVPVSTAADMARLTLHALEKPAFNFYTRIKQRRISVNRRGTWLRINLRTTNELLGQASIDGVQTGLTRRAGGCMIISARRRPTVRSTPQGDLLFRHRMVVVVLGSQDRDGLASALLRDGWNRYQAWLEGGRPVMSAAELLSGAPATRTAR